MLDLVIIGIGPAGLTASIYANRYKLSHVVVGSILGGMIALAHKVENYPGFTSVTGLELAQKMEEQVKSLGGEIVKTTVGKMESIPTGGFRAFGENGQTWEAKTIILANGSQRRQLGVPGEKEYLGKGVSYCTTCDAPFFKGKTVAMVGGSDSAVSGAIHAAEFAGKVYLIYRGEQLRAEPVWIEDALKNPKIEILYKTNVTKISGEIKVTGVELDNSYKNSMALLVDGVFIEIGGVPGSSLASALGVLVDQANYIKVGDDMSTNVPGFFSAGDLTDKAQVLVQMTTACAQGAIAAAGVYKFLKGQKPAQIKGI